MKQFLYDLKLSKKLLAVPIVVVFFMIILGVAAYISLTIQKSAIENIFMHNFKNYQTTANVVKDISTVHANIYKVISWANADYDIKKIEQLGKDQLAVLDSSLEKMLNVLNKKDNTKEETDLSHTVANDLAEYKKAAYSAIDLSGSDLNMATMYMNTADSKFLILYESLQKLLDLQNKLSEETYDFSLKGFKSALMVFVLVVLLAIGASVVFSIILNRFITDPIKETIRVTGKIAEGDLTQKIEFSSGDEIGQLVASVKTMVETLKLLLTETKSASDSVESAGHELSANSEQMSKGVAEQSARASQIAASSAEMSQTIINVARDSLTMASSAIEAAKAAKHGKEIVGKSVEEIRAVANTVNRSAQLMNSLGQRSKQIDNIVTVIKDISDQTNLLALNAAIEAARAGEDGRGFAVVADEVRKLAERTTGATSEIGEMIGAIQKEVDEAIKNMGDGTKKIDIGVEYAAKAGNALNTIVNSVENLQELVQQIASATDEISTVSEQISGDIGMIANVSNETSGSSKNIAQSASGLERLSSDLNRLIGQFRL